MVWTCEVFRPHHILDGDKNRSPDYPQQHMYSDEVVPDPSGDTGVVRS